MEIDGETDIVKSDEKVEENVEEKVDDKLDKEEFAYLKRGFSSEAFKIEIKNLPRHYGYGEIKKLVNRTLNIECHKIKLPRKNASFGFICFKNHEGESCFYFQYVATH